MASGFRFDHPSWTDAVWAPILEASNSVASTRTGTTTTKSANGQRTLEGVSETEVINISYQSDPVSEPLRDVETIRRESQVDAMGLQKKMPERAHKPGKEGSVHHNLASHID